jgi:hypothetical protein
MILPIDTTGDRTVMTEDGKPTTAQVDVEFSARIRRECFDVFSARIAEAYAGVPVEEGVAGIDATVAGQRKHRGV